MHNGEWTIAISARQTRMRCVGDGSSTLDLEMEMEILGQYSIEMNVICALR